jgi:glucose/mannose-6-phosphate isomerase
LSTTVDLSRESIASVDSARQIEDILAMPDQLRDALWRVESANLEPFDAPGGLIVAGMGGSAIGGSLARAALGDRASRSIVLARGYALPAWTTPDTAVLCASYSGNTEETLAVYEAAGALGARRIVATTGGKLADAARA